MGVSGFRAVGRVQGRRVRVLFLVSGLGLREQGLGDGALASGSGLVGFKASLRALNPKP